MTRTDHDGPIKSFYADAGPLNIVCWSTSEAHAPPDPVTRVHTITTDTVPDLKAWTDSVLRAAGLGMAPAATPAEQGKTRPPQDPRVRFWTRTRRVSGGSRAPADFVDFAIAPRLLATAFVVLEAAAATTCPQIAASAVLEAAATVPCPQAPPPPPRRVRGRLCW